MIYSSLFLIGAISLPAYASGTELIETENPVDGNFIVTTAPGVIPQGDDEIGASQANKIRQIIAGPNGDDMGAQSHGEVLQVYGSALEGFAASLDGVGLHNVLNSPDVVSVEQDGYVQLNQVGSWGLDRIDNKDLPLDQSYKPTFGNAGAGVTAYIIDTGILASHKEFEGRATQEFNSAGGVNEDCNGHGTHVAGTVGAKTYGVANKVKLVGVKVLSCAGGGTWAGVIAGIDWVAANAKKPATANMSLGGSKNVALNAAVKKLVDSGVSTVVAAGNNNGDACQKSPASEVSAITVGSTTNVDARSSFSNWGTCVDIFAPGSNIKAPWIGSDTATKTISGTSMASPHVCGATALYLAEDPSLSPDAVISKMSADSISGTITNVGSGSPNKFLFVGPDRGPTAPTTSAPTMSPTRAKNYRYQHLPKGCVLGQNIKLYKDKSVAECMRLCDTTANCVGFEYGVSHGGGSGNYQPRDCQPQLSSNTANCDGALWNLDFYKKLEWKACRTEKLLLEIDMTTGNDGNENTVSVRRKGKDGWARKALYHKDFGDNVMKKLTHCLHPDKCYKIVIKDKGGDGMNNGDGSYVIKVDGDVIKDSEFVTGRKEETLFNC